MNRFKYSLYILSLLLCFITSAVGRSLPIFNNGRFSNTFDERGLLHFVDGFNIFLETKTNREAYLTDDLNNWKAYDKPINSSKDLSIQWIGHSSFLIQINGINIITDPVFFNLSFLYPRNLPAGIAPENLPKIDVILISHNHRDHFDEPSLRLLKKHDPIVLAPLVVGTWFKKNGFTQVIEHNWWESTELPSGIKLTCLPAQHWCQRLLFDTNRALWSGWMISTDTKNIYFAGDTGYCKQYFSEIAEEFPKIDVAMLPIGPCQPRELMKHSHVDAIEAIKIFKKIKAKEFVPMHWGTFRLGTDSFNAPIKLLKQIWLEKNYDPTNLHILKFGQRKIFS